MKKKLVGNQNGFSLVELVIVIAIMAVLIGLLAPQFIKYVEKSRESKDLQNISEIKSAVEAYVADNKMEAGDEITIEISGNKAKVGGAAYTTGSLDEYGITDETALSSTHWASITLIYNISSGAYLWSEKDGKNLSAIGSTYFHYDGSVVS